MLTIFLPLFLFTFIFFFLFKCKCILSGYFTLHVNLHLVLYIYCVLYLYFQIVKRSQRDNNENGQNGNKSRESEVFYDDSVHSKQSTDNTKLENISSSTPMPEQKSYHNGQLSTAPTPTSYRKNTMNSIGFEIPNNQNSTVLKGITIMMVYYTQRLF